MAGLWERWTADRDGPGYAAGDGMEAFTIVTTAANDTVKPLHGRMPVILPPHLWDGWLDGSAGADVLLPYAGRMSAWRVSRAVNDVRNDGPDLIEPVATP